MQSSSPAPSPPRLARFGAFEADFASGDLRKQGLRIKLRGRPFEILGLLVERAGEVVTREELRQALWAADTFVDFDHGLNTAVNKLRETLGDTAENPRFVETLPRRGYRFVAPVEWMRKGGEPVRGEPLPLAAPEAPTEPVAQKPAPPPAGPPRRSMRIWLPAAVVLGVAALVFVGRSLRDREAPGPVRVAVLPFANLSGDPSQEYFVDGMTDALIAELAQLDGLRVISRTSVMPYKATRLSMPAIARELRVDSVIEGSVVRVGDRVRVTAQLIEGTSDRHLWAKNYERAAADVLGLQREVALDIAREVRATLSPRDAAHLAEQPSVDPRAYEAYLRGRFFWDTMSEKGLKTSIEFYERAIGMDPSYAPAYAGLADAYWILGSAGYEAAPPEETVPKARAAARKALELDPSLMRAEATLALIEIDHDWNFAPAERRLRAVLDQNPSLASVHVSFSAYLAGMGRFDESIAEARKGQELDPLSVVPVQTLAFRLYYARRFAEAEATFTRALDVDPTSFVARVGLGLVRWQQGRGREALAELERGTSASGGSTWARASLAHVLAATGNAARARELLKQLEAEARDRYLPPFYASVIHAALGERDLAMAGLEKSYAEKSGWMVFLRIEPFFDGLRSDPRFADLLARVGLPRELPKAKAGARSRG
jgi:TolB-like protein/DNA-binding winged helix-turn-helix (wHTH) protein/Tfp pilus assembly protein PilF